MLTAHGRSVEIEWDSDDDHISKRITESGDFYERALLDDCYERALPGMVVDAGAHIGNHTLWFAGIMGREVTAFEPNGATFSRLGLNIGRNKLWGQVRAHKAALGAERGNCEVLEGSPGNTGSAQVAYGRGSVPVVTLDSLNLMPAVVKIDVEGTAMPVLVGAVETLSRCMPLLYVETGADQEAVDSMLTGLGYFHQGWFGATPVHCYEAG